MKGQHHLVGHMMQSLDRLPTVLLSLFIGVSTITSTILAQDPILWTCSNNTTFAPNSTYENNLKSLIHILNNSGTPGIAGFYRTDLGQDPDHVYGLYLCRGDTNSDECQQCVGRATSDILRLCPLQKEAVAWYDKCSLRYSNSTVSPSLKRNEAVYWWDTSNLWDTANVTGTNQESNNPLVAVTLSESAAAAAVSSRKFAVRDVNYTSDSTQRLYILTQCTPDLSTSQCQECLQFAVGQLSGCCDNSVGASVFTENCYLRYETYEFYNGSAIPSPPPSPSSPDVRSPRPPLPSLKSTSNGSKPTKIVLSVSISSTLGVLLLLGGICIYTLHTRKKAREIRQQFHLPGLGRSTHSIIEEQRQVESQDFPHIKLDIINKATQDFSEANKLGEGGFGPVYKGTLDDGKEIAVKRIKRNSGQGMIEFMNEVILIARLQHRNLVRLVGCCLEKNENLLIYEYMPNKSLDMFVFDSSQASQLHWQRRLSIIFGVARGMQYLHEDSRLKIIHRDLKVSNVLLDNEMNSKISDFGMARIFGVDQNNANTNRVVGTYGYMAPEYAMEGLFSVKSDVFSFGVIVLEIISGKRNNGFYLSEQGESLLNYAWKMWSKGRAMELMDPLLTTSSDTTEVLKCIHIGLSCVQDNPSDRPSISHVVVTLASDTITLSKPSKPTFSVGRVSPISNNSSNHQVGSVNQVTLSSISPR